MLHLFNKYVQKRIGVEYNMEKSEHEELINIYKENEELRKAKNKAESEVLRQKTLRKSMKLELDAVKRELEAERMRKYDQYIPEDAAAYQAVVRDLQFYQNLVHDQTDYRKTLEKRIQELENQVMELTSDMPVKKAASIIEQNIEQDKLIKPAKTVGRPPKVDNHKVALILELKAAGHSIRAIARQLRISVGTVHRFIKLNNEKQKLEECNIPHGNNKV